MSVEDRDPLHRVAGQIADRFAESGYCFIEDDKVAGLAAALATFLAGAGIPVHPPEDTAAPAPNGAGRRGPAVKIVRDLLPGHPQQAQESVGDGGRVGRRLVRAGMKPAQAVAMIAGSGAIMWHSAASE